MSRVRGTRVGLALLLSLAASGCSPYAVAERFLLGDQFELARDIPYAGGQRHRLDVYRPRTPHGVAPVVVFLYGGRWQDGSKDEYHLVGDALTRAGLVAVIPEYRLYPSVRFPTWVEDAAAAVRWTRDNIGRFGGDPDRIFVVGHSAGGHTAALLGVDASYLRAAGVPRAAVRGIVVLAGPVDTVWTDPDVQALMGPRAGWAATYPATHVDGAEPPFLLLHGARDRRVSPGNSARFEVRLRERGGCVRRILYPGLGHVGIVVALAVPRLFRAPVFEDIRRFIASPAGSACPATAGR